MINRTILDDNWKSLSAGVMPPGASSGQVRDMHCCFMAGAATVLAELKAVANLPDELGIEVLSSMESEVAQHIIKLQNGEG